MITNELLKIKYDTQKRLDQEAQHRLEKYIEISHRNVQKIVADYGLKLKYGTPSTVGTRNAKVF
jgi:hypothetical protein